jgi:hypothetical protein
MASTDRACPDAIVTRLLQLYPAGVVAPMEMVNEGLSGATVLLVHINGPRRSYSPAAEIAEDEGTPPDAYDGLAFAKIDRDERCQQEYQRHARALSACTATFIPRIIRPPLGPIEGWSLILYQPAQGVIASACSLARLLNDDTPPVARLTSQVRRLLVALSACWHAPETLHSSERPRPLAELIQTMFNRGGIVRTDGLAAHLQEVGLPGEDHYKVLFMPGDLVLPNPFAYLFSDSFWRLEDGTPRQLVTPESPSHGDLHSGNIICRLTQEGQLLDAAPPWLIDFAQFEEKQLPFFDLAYLELDLLLRSLPVRSEQNWSEWQQMTTHLARAVKPTGRPAGMRNSAAWTMVQPIRQHLARLLRHTTASPAICEQYEQAWWLTAATVGALVARRHQVEQPGQRIAALLYASMHFEQLLSRVQHSAYLQDKNSLPVHVWWDKGVLERPVHNSHSTTHAQDTVQESTSLELNQGATKSTPKFQQPALELARAPRNDFYGHVTQVTNYVERGDVLKSLRDALSGGATTVAITSDQRIKGRRTALHGLGGIGKTVLARALCDDPQVQQAFPGGIYWATIGKDPDLITRLREWIYRLGGNIPEYLPTLDILKDILSRLLQDRSCLLILDDVWKKTHVEPFLVGGPRCRLIITTRDAEIAHAIGAKIEKVPLMNETEALQLLEVWAEGNLYSAPPETKKAIVDRLGYLPLALKLAGAQLRNKDAETWLANFKALELKAKRVDKIHDSLELTFSLSLDELDLDTLNLYLALAIFKEDEIAPEQAVFRLWSQLGGYSDIDAADLLDDLASRALLDLFQMPNGKGFALHDLVFDLLHEKLGERIVNVHLEFLDSYGPGAGSAWDSVEDDGYLYDHLVYHLHASQRHTEIMQLVGEEAWMRARFFQHGYTFDGYVDDLDMAWKLASSQAKAEISKLQEPRTLSTCILYALIGSTIASLAGAYTPSLVGALVDLKIWTVRRALSVANKVFEIGQRVEMYAAILSSNVLSPDQRSEAEEAALKAIISTTGAASNAQLLTRIAPHLSNWEIAERLLNLLRALSPSRLTYAGLSALVGVMPETFATAFLQQALTLSDCYGVCAILVSLRPELTEAQARQIYDTLIEFDEKDLRFQALLAVLPFAPRDVQKSALGSAIWQDEREYAELVSALASHLTDELVEQALARVEQISDLRWHLQALSSLVPYLSSTSITLRLKETISLIHGVSKANGHLTSRSMVDDPELRALPRLKALAPRLEADDLDLVIQSSKTSQMYAEMISVLAPHLKEELLAKALARADKISDIRWRLQALSSLIPRLPPRQQRKALGGLIGQISRWYVLHLRSADDLDDAFDSLHDYFPSGGVELSDILVNVAPQLDEALASKVLKFAKDAQNVLISDSDLVRIISASISKLAFQERQAAIDLLLKSLEESLLLYEEQYDDEHPLAVLIPLFPNLSEESAERVLELISIFSDDVECAQILVAIALHLSEESVARVLELISNFSDDAQRAQVLVAIASRFSKQGVERAMPMVLELSDASLRQEVTLAFAPFLEGPDLERLIGSTLVISDDEQVGKALMSLAPSVSGVHVEPMLRSIDFLPHESMRVAMLQVLLPKTTSAAAEIALSKISEIRDETRRSNALAEIASFISDEHGQERLIRAVKDTKSSVIRADTLKRVVPYLGASALNQVSEACLTLVPALRDEPIMALLSQLVNTKFDRAEQLWPALDRATLRVEALTILGLRARRDQRNKFWNLALQELTQISDNSEKLESLQLLTRHLPGEYVNELLKQIELLPDGPGKTYVRRSLYPVIPPPDPLSEWKQFTAGATGTIDRSLVDLWFILLSVASALPAAQVGVAFYLAVAAGTGSRRTLALAALAVHASIDDRVKLWTLSMRELITVPDSSDKGDILALFSGLIPTELCDTAIRCALSIPNYRSWRDLLLSLGRRLDAPSSQATNQEIVKLQSAQDLVYAASVLGRNLPSSVRDAALQRALTIKREPDRLMALQTLIPALESQQLERLREMLSDLMQRDGSTIGLNLTIASHISNPNGIMRPVREELLRRLNELRQQPRRQILELFTTSALFNCPILSSNIVGEICAHSVGVCWEWRWS